LGAIVLKYRWKSNREKRFRQLSPGSPFIKRFGTRTDGLFRFGFLISTTNKDVRIKVNKNQIVVVLVKIDVVIFAREYNVKGENERVYKTPIL